VAGNKSVFITHPIFRQPAWGGNHPLAIARHRAVLELCESLGWLKAGLIEACTPASFEQLSAYHDAAYVSAFRQASASGQVSAEARSRFNFGTLENPIFPGVYERAAAAVGGSIRAAEHALAGRRAFHPAGGTHHGQRGRAHGFCYFNDPVFAIRALLAGGADPVLYVDLDAHHGDGVETAFAGDARVFMISIHEADRWPHSGGLDRHGGGNVRNFPVPRAFNDSELAFLIDGPVAELARRVAPQAVVIVAGADCLRGDPLSAMALSNGAFWDAVERVCGFAPAQVVLGGGGYNPWTTARAWAGLWGRLAGFALPHALPRAAVALLKEMSCDLVDDDERDPCWTTSLCDAPNPGPVRAELHCIAKAALAP
jgi:acetoin utilization protein AcuC